MDTLTVAILVVSTTAASGTSTDASGPALAGLFAAEGAQWRVTATEIVADDAAAITAQILDWTDNTDTPANLVVTTGGTGFATADITPEAVAALIQKPAPGLVHGMLAASLQVTPFAVMARPVAGVRGQTVLVTLPGSPKGATENLQAVLRMLPHACVLAAGTDSRSLHARGVGALEIERTVAPSTSSTSSTSHTHSHGCGHSHTHSHTHGHNHGLVRHDVPADTPASSALLSNDPSLGPSRRNRASPFPMVSVDEALRRIEQVTPEAQTTTVAVGDALVGHVLAEDVYAAEDVPAFRASIVDGYAVVVPGPGDAAGTLSGTFSVVGVSHAAPGDAGQTLAPGAIARITTGAPLPAGANAVVMVESTVLVSQTADGSEEDEVEIRAADVRDGDNVREVGSDVRKGQVVMRRGESVTAVGGEVGLLLAAGLAQVTVFRRPVVGVLSTGNELVTGASDTPRLAHGQVRDTNRPTLLAAAAHWGFATVDLGIAADTPGALEAQLRGALRQADVVVTTGGVSMGELDLLKPTIERALGGSIHFGRVAMKPGKPTTFATVAVKEVSANSTARTVKPVFALPGNPASALVTFHLFVLPALHKMAGAPLRGLPKAPVTLAHAFALDRDRPEYHRAVVTVTPDGTLQAASTGGQRSSKVGSMHTANALLCMPAGPAPLPAGAKVDALLMGPVLGL